ALRANLRVVVRSVKQAEAHIGLPRWMGATLNQIIEAKKRTRLRRWRWRDPRRLLSHLARWYCGRLHASSNSSQIKGFSDRKVRHSLFDRFFQGLMNPTHGLP
ncbi:MAG: hypothetical protein DMG47_17330, partial [Acidobacteria bacterium]